MSALFDPLTIGNVEFANRIWVSPMCQYMAEDGFVGQWHDVHLGSFATGGTGLIMVEATGVVREGRISIGCPSIEDDEHAAAFAPIIHFAHQHNVKVGIQLAHAGRKAGTALPWADHRMATPEEGGWQAVSSSAIAFEGYPEPRALTIAEIHQLTKDFASAAKRAIDVGFDVIEIHAAHGYLMHQFYSPLANTRTDQYGGSFENRIRLVIELFTAVRANYQGVLGIRLSAYDWVEGGWTPEETAELALRLKALGCNYVHVSSGGVSHLQKIAIGPNYQVSFAKMIKEKSALTTMAVGLITEPHQAEAILQAGDADLVALARAFLYKPRWAWEAAAALQGEVTASSQYWRCLPREAQTIFGAVRIGQR